MQQLNSCSNYTAALKLLGLYNNESSNINPSKDTDNDKTTSASAMRVQVGIPEIKRAYRRLARVHHPDRGGNKKSFIRLTAAKDFLVNGGATSSTCGDGKFDPFHWEDGSDSCVREETASSRVLMRGRSCVRDLASVYHPSMHSVLVLAATDDGLKMMQGEGGKTQGCLQQVMQFESESFLCCALSVDGRFAFAGNAKGQVRRYLLHKDTLCSAFSNSDGGSDAPIDHIVGYALNPKKGVMGYATKNSIVCLDVRDNVSASAETNTSSHIDKVNRHIVIAACDSPTAVVMFRFNSNSVEVLWRITNAATCTCNLLHSIRTIDTLMLSPAMVSSEVSETSGEQKTCSIWLGGSNNSNEATLVNWQVCLETETQSSMAASTASSIGSNNEDEEWWWSDSSDDENYETECGMEIQMPSTTSTEIQLGFGSIYSIDTCPELNMLAATVGSDVILLEPPQQGKENNHHEDSSSIDGSSLQMKKTLTTNHVLYCVKILSQSLQIAACGAGESIIIWSLVNGTIQQNIHLNSPKHCNLSTNCIMALDWFVEEEEQEGRVTSIVSGGYDGNITRWLIDASCDETILNHT